MTDQGPVREATAARQGRTGTGARWVLRISLGLIVVIFAAIWFAYAHRGGGAGGTGGQEASGQRFSTTPDSVRESAATAAPGSVAAQTAGRKEQTTGG